MQVLHCSVGHVDLFLKMSCPLVNISNKNSHVSKYVGINDGSYNKRYRNEGSLVLSLRIDIVASQHQYAVVEGVGILIGMRVRVEERRVRSRS